MQQQNLDELILKLEARERASWRTSLLWTIVPAVLALLFLGYATMRLTEANREVASLQEQAVAQRTEVERLQNEAEAFRTETRLLRNEAEKFRTESERLRAEVADSMARIENMQAEIGTLQEKLRETLNLSKYEHPLDMVDMKMFYSRYPQAGPILDMILELQRDGVGWKLGGETPAEGFDSPSFAAFVLQKVDKLPRNRGESLLSASRRLHTSLDSTRTPEVGDLAIYPGGYHLFVFEDDNRQRYVIGMTPIAGIVALKPDFAEVIGYRKIP
jgi:hypothetical protein